MTTTSTLADTNKIILKNQLPSSSLIVLIVIISQKKKTFFNFSFPIYSSKDRGLKKTANLRKMVWLIFQHISETGFRDIPTETLTFSWLFGQQPKWITCAQLSREVEDSSERVKTILINLGLINRTDAGLQRVSHYL